MRRMTMDDAALTHDGDDPERRWRLVVALEQLSAQQRIALALLYTERLQFAEIGVVLGISTKDARRLLESTIQALEASLLPPGTQRPATGDWLIHTCRAN